MDSAVALQAHHDPWVGTPGSNRHLRVHSAACRIHYTSANTLLNPPTGIRTPITRLSSAGPAVGRWAEMVWAGGFEPPTSRSRSARSKARLSYAQLNSFSNGRDGWIRTSGLTQRIRRTSGPSPSGNPRYGKSLRPSPFPSPPTNPWWVIRSASHGADVIAWPTMARIAAANATARCAGSTSPSPTTSASQYSCSMGTRRFLAWASTTRMVR